MKPIEKGKLHPSSGFLPERRVRRRLTWSARGLCKTCGRLPLHVSKTRSTSSRPSCVTRWPWSDRLVVLDNGSQDGTSEVLRAFRKEGLPLDIVTDRSVGKYQSRRMTRLMHDWAIGRYDADWVVALDGDEFLVIPQDTPLIPEDIQGDQPISLPWRTYVVHGSDEPGETNPVLRIRHRRVAEGWEATKVMVPRAVAALPSATLVQGSHEVCVDGQPCQPRPHPAAYLAHFPLRSAGQYAAKIAINSLQYQTMPERNWQWAYHYKEPFELLKRDLQAFTAGFAAVALHYAAPREAKIEPATVIDPICYRGGPLRWTPPLDDMTRAWHTLLSYAEDLSRRFGVLASGLTDDQQFAVQQQAAIVSGLHDQLEQQRKHLAYLVNRTATERDDQQKTQAALAAAMTAQLAQAQGQHEETKKQLTETNKHFGETNDELAAAKGQLSEAKGQLGASREQLEQTTVRLGEARKQLGKTEQSLAETTVQLEQTRASLAGASGQLDQTRSQLEGTAAQLAEATGQLHETKSQLSETNGRLGATKAELSATHGHLEETQSRLGETTEQLAATTEQLAATKTHLEKARTQLALVPKSWTWRIGRLAVGPAAWANRSRRRCLQALTNLRSRARRPKLPMANLEIHVAHGCNLRCESCSHYANQGHGRIVSIEDADRWMKLWNRRVRPAVFSLLGGEPAMHPQLADFVRMSRKNWPEAELRLITNGFLLRRHPDLPAALRDTGTRLFLTVHHDSPQYREKIQPIVDLVETWVRSHGIQVEYLHSHKNWTRRYKGSGSTMEPFDDRQPRVSWENCVAKGFYQLFEGQIWKCAPLAYLQLQAAKYELSGRWRPYLQYQPLRPDCTSEELAALSGPAGRAVLRHVCQQAGTFRVAVAVGSAVTDEARRLAA